MSSRTLKYLFVSLMLLMLITMLVLSRDAARNCDEVLHYEHSEKVLDYYFTHGKDTSAINTPLTHLKYYGQSYDNLTTLLIRIFRIEDVYSFRHVMSSLAGWLVVLISALLAIRLSGIETGIMVIILFAVSPVFIGHSQNNLKDIPFALGYISGLYFMFIILKDDKWKSPFHIVLLIFSIAFCISIRAGGFILIFYFLLFTAFFYSVRAMREGRIAPEGWKTKLLIMALVIVGSYFLGILFWPYAMRDPVRNPLEAYKAMAHFPDTFRQIFEGRAEWSDYMPWYYLPKSMLITIPVVVLGGLFMVLLSTFNFLRKKEGLFFWFLLFTVLFPLFFVILKRSNLYSSWRQFLFVYPGLIILSATGYTCIFKAAETGLRKWYLAGLIFLMSLSPVYFMVRNYPYSYLYYNQFAGGLKGALGKYETDYYYVSQQEASEWLIEHLVNIGRTENITVAANFSVEWFFRKYPGIKTLYVRNEERSMKEWDYLIMTNRYISPHQLKSGLWPPSDALKVIYAAQVPIGAVVERRGREALEALREHEAGNDSMAVAMFKEAIKKDEADEMIFYNFAAAEIGLGNTGKADSLLKVAISINPDFDLAMMYLGNIAVTGNRDAEAAGWYRKTIESNRKNLEAYVALAAILSGDDPAASRAVLKECLSVNPVYKPAIKAMAESYRTTRPDLAEEYDRLADSITD